MTSFRVTRRVSIWAGGCAAGILLCCPVWGSISSYTDLTSWEAGTPSSTLENFNSVSSGYYDPYSTATDGTIQANDSNNGGPSNPVGVDISTTSDLGSGQYVIPNGASYTQTGTTQGVTEYYEYEYSYACGFFDNSTCYAWSGTEISAPGSTPSTNYSNDGTVTMTLTPPAGTTWFSIRCRPGLQLQQLQSTRYYRNHNDCR